MVWITSGSVNSALPYGQAPHMAGYQEGRPERILEESGGPSAGKIE